MPDYIPPPSTLKPGSIVWAYLRDSGGASQEQSVSQQEAEILAYCELHGLVLTHIFSDAAKSGGSAEGRDQFNTMIDGTKNPEARPAGLLVWNLARFSRDLDDSDYFKATLRKRGVTIHSLTDPIPEGPFGRMVEKLIDISNEEKRRQNSRDVKRALLANARQGYSTGGYPPRGYKAEKVEIGKRRDGQPRIVSRWVPDPEFWELVKLAWQLRAEGKLFAEITKATGGKVYKSKGCWTTFFRNKTYLGIGKCGEIEIPDHHEAAINWETWEAARRVTESHSTYSNSRRIAYPSLLGGIAFCRKCGAAMVHHKGAQSRNWPYYVCGSRDRKRGAEACDVRRVNARVADRSILNLVLGRILTPAWLEELIDEIQTQLEDPAAFKREITKRTRELHETEKAIKNLLDLAEISGAGAVKDRLKDREAKRSRLKVEIGQLEKNREAVQVEITPEAVAVVLDVWRQQVTEAQARSDLEALRGLVRRFVAKIDMDYDRARIQYTYPFYDGLLPPGNLALGGTS